MGRRILFVAMQMSIHVARWIKSIEHKGWDLHLFPVNSVRRWKNSEVSRFIGRSSEFNRDFFGMCSSGGPGHSSTDKAGISQRNPLHTP